MFVCKIQNLSKITSAQRILLYYYIIFLFHYINLFKEQSLNLSDNNHRLETISFHFDYFVLEVYRFSVV